LKKRVKITIKGAVQGVGFRPFVYRLATELNLKGWINNSTQGVFIDAEGDESNVISFIERLKSDKPAISRIQSFEHTYTDVNGFDKFEIVESKSSGAKTALVLPDIATCPDCLEEIFNPVNRRYLYPFTNCTNCGPRFSIIKSLPYDRKNTTMAEFEMCEDCKAEYTNPLDRRFHAEPTACPKCGPQVSLWNEKGTAITEKNDAILKTAELIKQGKIVALKGIGGFQLLVDANNDNAVKELRTRKHRSEKPFALMFPDLDSVRVVCNVSEQEEALLKSIEAPIILLKRKTRSVKSISDEVAAGNPYLGVMLPYSPLHHILMSYLNIPIVATSGNISEEPICIDEKSALEKLNGIADFYLVHDRKILRHVDDSIVRISAGNEYLIRRARGYAPMPIQIAGADESVLAAGAHLKNTIAVNKGTNVFISQHIGDLENEEAVNAFERVIDDLESFYEINPKAVVCDLHPDYISTKYAKSIGKKVHQVQHHYAHVLSCMAENEITGNVLGVSWDGTGYGTDGTIWGSEFLISDGAEFKRFAHLKSFVLPGGEKAIEQVWRLGFALLYNVYGDKALGMNDIALIKNHKPGELNLIKQLIDKGINSPVTTSMGRLFDAVTAIIGIKMEANFEAQAAMELEFAANDIDTNELYEFDIVKEDESYIIDWKRIVEGVIFDLRSGISNGLISAKFHNTLAEIIIDIAKLAGEKKVVLTGGCFLNKYLHERSINRLKEEKFKVYWHTKVPAGDGGISLGQIKYSTYK